MNENRIRRSGCRKWKKREENVLCNCSTVPRNGTGVDNEYDRLGVTEVISILNPDTWMAGNVYSLDGLLHVWKGY